MRYFLIFFILATQLIQAQDYVEVYQSGMQAREEGDRRLYLHYMQQADSLRPQHPTILFRLGAANILAGSWEQGLESLRSALILNATLPLEDEPDLETLRQREEFSMLTAFRDSLMQPVITSQVAFSLGENDLHLEGLAHDPVAGRWYAGSVHKRKIVTWIGDGEVSDYTGSGQDGLMAVMGLDVDARQRLLWITSVPAREMINDSIRVPAFVRAYDLATGQVRATYSAPDTLEHWFGDLQVSANGDVYFTDTPTNRIYRIRNGELSTWVELAGIVQNIQGIAVRKEDLIVSDYLTSLYRIDLRTREIRQLDNPYPELILKGTDGVYAKGNTLVLTINGQIPNRLIQLRLDGTTIQNYRVLDRNHPDFGEPTLGTILNNEFYYIGNSPWGAYDREGNLNALELPPVRILRVELKE